MNEDIIGIFTVLGIFALFAFINYLSSKKTQKTIETPEQETYRVEMQEVAKQKAMIVNQERIIVIKEKLQKGELSSIVDRKVLIGLLRSTAHSLVELQMDVSNCDLYVKTPNLSAKMNMKIKYNKE